MNRFYISVAQSGDDVLVREVVGDKRVKHRINFQPTLFVPSKQQTSFTTIDGHYVEPIRPGGIYDTRNWLKQYEGLPDFQIYGNKAYYYQWIAEEYPDEHVDYDLSKIQLWSLDIECESENGFPNPENAAERINVIAFKNITQNKTYIFGLEVYGKKYVPEDPTIEYFAFDDEQDLIFAFGEFWKMQEPDVVTGWSISFFDIPYIINRAMQFFDHITIKNWFSPWGKIDEESVRFMEQEKKTYNIVGVNIIDYLRIYKKYTFDPRENFQLGYISMLEIGETKMGHDEYENFSEFYRNNYPKFVDYCVKDSLLVEKLEDKLKMLELTFVVAYQAHINFEDVLSQVRTWDMQIYNYLKRKNIVIPFKSSFDKGEKYAGAYVKDPKPGLYKWVVSFDVTSLYPSIIMALNIGVESKLGRPWDTKDPHEFLDVSPEYEKWICEAKSLNSTLSINGVMYSRDHISFFSELTQKLFLDRVEYRKQLKICKDQLKLVKKEINRRKWT